MTSKSSKDNADNLKTLPNEDLLSPCVSDDDFTCPFANSEVTTNDCVVRFQITLKILFMEYKILLYKFNRINNTLDKTHTKRNLTGHSAREGL